MTAAQQWGDQRALETSTVDPLALLALMQLHDSGFPSGRFVHSSGLETWLAAHPAAGKDELGQVARSHLATGVATSDARALVWAWHHEEPESLVQVDRWLTAHKSSLPARKASLSPGRQLAVAAAQVHPAAGDHHYLRKVRASTDLGNVAVVEAVLGRALGIPVVHLAIAHLRAAHAGLLSAAVRLGRAGPLWVQRQLAADAGFLADLAVSAIGEALDAVDQGRLPRLTTTAWQLEIYAMRHDRASGRLFST